MASPLILTWLRPPGATCCRQSSCRGRRRAPSLFSQTSPSAKPCTFSTLPGRIRSSFSEKARRGHLSFQRVAELCSCQGALTTLQVLDHHLAKPIAHVHLDKWTDHFRLQLKCAIFDYLGWTQSRNKTEQYSIQTETNVFYLTQKPNMKPVFTCS